MGLISAHVDLCVCRRESAVKMNLSVPILTTELCDMCDDNEMVVTDVPIAKISERLGYTLQHKGPQIQRKLWEREWRTGGSLRDSGDAVTRRISTRRQ